MIDGASSDGTLDILKANEPRLAYLESKRDSGIYEAWNDALPHVRGEWICFIGADDAFASPDTLRSVSAVLADVPTDALIAYGRVRYAKPDGTSQVVGRPWSETRGDFMKYMAIPHQAVFHRRSLFDQRGGFDEHYRICGDYDLLLRELRHNDPIFMDIVVTEMGGHGLSSRPASERLMRREFHRARHANGLTKVPEWLDPGVVRIEIRDWMRRSLGARWSRAAEAAYARLRRRHRA